MSELRIVKGNDFYLKINVTKKIIGQSSAVALELDKVSNRKVLLGTVECESSLTSTAGQLIVKVSGLKIGTYSLTFAGTYGGNAIRACELKMITIVNNAAESNVTASTYEGEDAYDLDLQVQLYQGIATEVDAVPTQGSQHAVQSGGVYDALALKANTTDVNTALAGKANTTHTHTKSQISDFPSSLPASDVKAWAKADSKPSYTASEITDGTKTVHQEIEDIASNKVDKTSEEELTIQANEITLKSDNGIKIKSSSDNDIYIGSNTRNAYLDIDTEDGIVSSFGESLQLSADDSISIISNANEVTIGSGLPDTGIRLTSDGTSYFKESGDIEIEGGSLSLEGNTFDARFQSTMEISNGEQEEEWHGISVKNRVLKMQGDSAELSADGGIDIKGGDSLNLEVYNNSNIVIGTNNHNTRIDINGQSKQISFYASDVSFNTAVDFSERATIQGDSIATQEYVDDKVGDIGAEFNRVDDDINEVANGDYGQPDYEALPLLCGQPPILFGAGTPREAVVPTNWKQFADGGYNWNGLPSAIGQVYINTSATSNGRYTAYQKADGTLAWLNF